MNETTRHTLSVLVENTAGVLSQVSRLFSRKGYNIDSLAVGTTDDPKISRITIEIDTDDASARQIANQLRKLFPVYSVQELSPDDSIRRELVMIKVRAANSEDRNEVIQIANIFRASIIDVSTQFPDHCHYRRRVQRWTLSKSSCRASASLKWFVPVWSPWSGASYYDQR